MPEFRFLPPGTPGRKAQARAWWGSLSSEEQAAYVERIVQRRANSPKRLAAVEEQAITLIIERMKLFGPEWRINCAICIPAWLVDPFEDDSFDDVDQRQLRG